MTHKSFKSFSLEVVLFPDINVDTMELAAPKKKPFIGCTKEGKESTPAGEKTVFSKLKVMSQGPMPWSVSRTPTLFHKLWRKHPRGVEALINNKPATGTSWQTP